MIIRLLLLAIVFVGTPLHAKGNEKPSGKDYESSLIDAPDKSTAIEEEDHAYLLRHNPFYFAYANPTSKVQLSFRTTLIKKVPLYFGYTQVMFWELLHNSKPFQDLTFNPELFYRVDMNHGWLDNFDAGYEHTSNGKAGDPSRSYNDAFLRLNFKKELRRWITKFSIKAAYLHAFDTTNANLREYVGPLSYKISFIQLFDSWVDKTELSVQATPGGKAGENWGKGGYQFSASFRLGRVNVIPSFYLQYYTGYAESLLNYDRNISTFRGGFIF